MADDMKSLTGIDWPLDADEKKRLRAERAARRERLLAKPENKRAYDEMGLAYEVAEQLHEARKKAHLTQRQLAERLHTSQSNLVRIEQGRNITLNTLDGYARACGRKVRIQLV